jgi:pyroglutamyl-peptidase
MTRPRSLLACLGMSLALAIANGPVRGVEPAAPFPAVDTVLLFGFGPFAGRAENASWLEVRQFSGAGRVRSVELPVVWGAPWPVLGASVKGAGRVLLVGLGEGSDRFNVETVAYNERGKIHDEEKNLPAVSKVQADGPNVRRLAGPAAALAEKLSHRGFPAQVSENAGRFLCNEMLYDLLRLQEQDPQVEGVFFIHVPVLNRKFSRDGKMVTMDREQCAAFGLALAQSLRELYPLANEN